MSETTGGRPRVHIHELEAQLEALERQCPGSNLVIYWPQEEQGAFFNNLCQIYLDASQQDRARIRAAVSDKQGVLNRLLGHVYQCARRLHTAADAEWLRIGLAAASIENCSSDYRDFLLALAELYVAAEEVGLNPRAPFRAVAAISSRETPRGGMTPVGTMLARFHTYGALRERRGRRRGEHDA